jgi:DNA-binding FadR family transcriptional regulator
MCADLLLRTQPIPQQHSSGQSPATVQDHQDIYDAVVSRDAERAKQ